LDNDKTNLPEDIKEKAETEESGMTDGARAPSGDASPAAGEGITTENKDKHKRRRRQASKLAWYWIVLIEVITIIVTFAATFSSMYVDNKNTVDRLRSAYASKITYNTAVIDAIKYIYETRYIGEYGEFDPDDYLRISMSSFETWDSETITDLLASVYVARSGDKYGAYYTAEEYGELMNTFAGSTVGIGIYVSYNSDEECIEVLYVFDGPAKDAGILPGDLIVSVEGSAVSEVGYEGTLDLIKGEEGTDVTLTLMRDGSEMTFTVTRAPITSLSVFEHLTDDGKTGVIRITDFYDNTPEQFRNAVDSLQGAGAERLVFDLRDCPGGLVTSVLSVLSYIFPEGTGLMKEVDKAGEEIIQYSDDEHVIDCPMAVLVNSSTASAGELFTINMRDFDKAVIVGETTYGKGVEQTFFTLPNGGKLKVTWRWYSSVVSGNYDGIGISPDIDAAPYPGYENVNIFKLADENDGVLQAALAYLDGLDNP